MLSADRFAMEIASGTFGLERKGAEPRALGKGDIRNGHSRTTESG